MVNISMFILHLHRETYFWRRRKKRPLINKKQVLFAIASKLPGVVLKKIQNSSVTRYYEILQTYYLFTMLFSLLTNLRVAQGDEQDRARSLEEAISKLMTERQEVEKKVLQSMSERTTLQQEVRNAFKEIGVLQESIHQREVSVGQIENELARIKVRVVTS